MNSATHWNAAKEGEVVEYATITHPVGVSSVSVHNIGDYRVTVREPHVFLEWHSQQPICELC